MPTTRRNQCARQLWWNGIDELAVGAPAVALDHLGEAGPQDGGDLGKAPALSDQVDHEAHHAGVGSGGLAHEVPGPGTVATYPPAALIRGDDVGLANGGDEAPVGGGGPPPRPGDSLGDAPRGDGHSE